MRTTFKYQSPDREISEVGPVEHRKTEEKEKRANEGRRKKEEKTRGTARVVEGRKEGREEGRGPCRIYSVGGSSKLVRVKYIQSVALEMKKCLRARVQDTCFMR